MKYFEQVVVSSPHQSPRCGAWRVEKAWKFWLPTMSVGNPPRRGNFHSEQVVKCYVLSFFVPEASWSCLSTNIMPEVPLLALRPYWFSERCSQQWRAPICSRTTVLRLFLPWRAGIYPGTSRSLIFHPCVSYRVTITASRRSCGVHVAHSNRCIVQTVFRLMGGRHASESLVVFRRLQLPCRCLAVQ